jgi:transposase-like protein
LQGEEEMAQQASMTLMEFMENFGTEEQCRTHLYGMRWPEGFVCPKCGAIDNPYNIKSHNRYQCKHCNHQTSVTAGTVMDKSRTPLTKWFLAIYLMGQDKRGCSALKLKRELGIAYDTAWTMSHKMRKAMSDRDADYLLSGTVDVDDSFFGAARIGSKRGRGTEKTAVVFGVSFDRKGRPEYLKAKVVETVDGEIITAFAKENIEPGSRLRSDGLSSYRKLGKVGFVHEPQNFDHKENPDHLKWLHVVVSNAKSFILGTYHGLDSKHLQSYLDEFSFRFSRRFWHNQLFNRILCSCTNSSKFTRYDLIG